MARTGHSNSSRTCPFRKGARHAYETGEPARNRTAADASTDDGNVDVKVNIDINIEVEVGYDVPVASIIQ